METSLIAFMVAHSLLLAFMTWLIMKANSVIKSFEKLSLEEFVRTNGCIVTKPIESHKIEANSPARIEKIVDYNTIKVTVATKEKKTITIDIELDCLKFPPNSPWNFLQYWPRNHDV